MRRPAAIALVIVFACSENPTSPTTVASVTVAPLSATLLTGDTVRLVAIARNDKGDTLAGRAMAWRSSDPAIATVTTSGLVTGRAEGVSTITAESEGRNGDAIIAVVRRVATLAIGGIDTLFTGDSTFWEANGYDSAGHQLPGRTVIWSVSDPSLVRPRPIQYDVWLTAQAPGMVWVKATIEAVSDSARLWVRNRVASVTIAPEADTIVIGDTLRLLATARDSAGNVLTDRSLTWMVQAGPAIVDPSGLLRSHAGGTAYVVARAETRSDTAIVLISPDGFFTQLSVGDAHTCGVTSHQVAYCWGENNWGNLGLGTVVHERLPSPRTVAGFAAESLSARAKSTCALSNAGAAPCWGFDNHGQLGNSSGTVGCEFAPCRGTPLAVIGGLRYASVSMGVTHACGLVGGTAYCWGANASGQLGTGTADGAIHESPQVVSAPSALAVVSAGGAHSCGIDAGGLVYCWGANSSGELGRGATDATAHPTLDTLAGGLRFVAVSAAEDYTCGIVAGGAAYCWGRNDFGQLGVGAQDSSIHATPTPVVGTSTFLAISAGGHTTCGITTTQMAYCWGDNQFGQLGVSSTGQSCQFFSESHPCSRTPVPVSGGLRFQMMSAGYYHTCGVATDGRAYCWGDNFNGELGDGSFTDRSSPVRVDGQP